MARTFWSWLGSWRKRTSRRVFRPECVRLEDRTTPTNFDWASVRSALNAGQSSLLSGGVDSGLAGLGFGADLPLVGQTVASALGLADRLEAAFSPALGGSTSFAAARGVLEDAGFRVEYVSLSPQAGTGDLVRIRWDKAVTTLPTFTASGSTGFEYFDKQVNGRLAGKVTATAPTVRVGFTLGVDVQAGRPTFYVAEDQAGRLGGVSVEGMNLSGTVTGDLSIGRLANVRAEGTVSASLGGKLSLAENGGDGKLRLAQLTGSLASSTVGGLDGTFTLGGADARGMRLTARLPVLADLSWFGKWVATITDGSAPSFRLPAFAFPFSDPTEIFRQLGSGLFQASGGFPILGDIGNLLRQKLPVLDVSLFDKLGLSEIGWLLDAPAVSTGGLSIDGVRARLGQYGVSLLPAYLGDGRVEISEAWDALGKMIRGQAVELVRFTKSGGREWNRRESVPLGAVPIPPLPIVLTATASVEAYVGWRYKVGLGIDTTGFYIDPDTGVSLGGGLRGGVGAEVSLAGLFGVGLTVGAGIRVGAEVGLNDPDPTDGKIYLDEIFRDGESLAGGFLGSMRVRLTGEANGFARGELSLPWPLPDVTLFDEEFAVGTFWNTSRDQRVPNQADGRATRRVRDLASDRVLTLPVQTAADGTRTLSIAGTGVADQVAITGGRSALEVTWFGKGTATFTNIDRVRFLGGEGDDRLDVASSVNVAVTADGGGGNDFLSGGALGDSLVGGAGDDQLEGAGGNDTLAGGADGDELLGGGGNDSIWAGAGDDVADGESGNDTLFGEAGRDALAGGLGNDRLDGGIEDDFINGGANNDTLAGGTGDNYLDGDENNDSLSGSAGNDVMSGGTGNDTLAGLAGDDRLDGGAGADRLEGGTGHDRLEGAAGADTIFGGSGNDTLNGGADADRLFGDGLALAEAGEDRFEIDFDTNQGVATDQLFGGPLKDQIAILGTVALGAGTAPGSADINDSIHVTQVVGGFEAAWRPAGSTQAARTVRFSMPADIDELVVLGLGGDDVINVTQAARFPIVVDGGPGNDTLVGGAGRDTIRGGVGNDQILGRGGDDHVSGGVGHDTIDGGDGGDAAYGEDGNDLLLGGGGRDVLYGGIGNDVILAGPGIIGVMAYGGPGDDQLTGGDGVDVLFGGENRDTLAGGDLLDLLYGEAGDDQLVGGAGRDFLFGGADDDSLFTSGTPGFPDPSESPLTPEELNALVSVYRQVFANKPELLGFLNDALARRAGGPWSSEDEYALRAELQYASLTRTRDELEYTKSLLNLKRLATGLSSDEQALLVRIENTLAATLLAQVGNLSSQGVLPDLADGGAGNDTLQGGFASDQLNGNDGDDLLYHSPGLDSVQGGNGSADVYAVRGTEADDLVTMAFDPDTGDASVVINANPGVTANLLDIEQARAEGLGGNDQFTLAGLLQKVPFDLITFDGGSGNDLIDGGGLTLADGQPYEGRVRFLGGIGNDTLVGGAAADSLDGGSGSDQLTGGEGGDTLYGGTGDDTLDGGAGVDWADGGADDDRLEASPGDDTMTGGDGHDEWHYVGTDRLEFVYMSFNSALRFSILVSSYNEWGINTETTFDGGRSGDFERHSFDLRGGADSFGLVGSDNPAVEIFVDGGAGNDFLAAHAWYNTLIGGDGDDFLCPGGYESYVSGLANYLDGGSGNDTLCGDGGNDTLIGGSGDDFIEGRYGNDSLDGGDGNDTLIGGDGRDTLIGGSGDDHLTGSHMYDNVVYTPQGIYHYWSYQDDYGEIDSLDGGEGNDTLVGFGADEMNGGNGLDWYQLDYETEWMN